MPKLICVLVLTLGFATSASAGVTFEWVHVGNPGNAADTTGFGAVSDSYRISKYEVTNAQYAEFLSTVASTTDPHGLFNTSMAITKQDRGGGISSYEANVGFEARPVGYISFLDAMRFVNWLENGQGTGGTESGVYSIVNGLAETRTNGAHYFIPSEDEWYKAAYHDPGAAGTYWDYPTRSNVLPNGEVPPGSANGANVASAVGDSTDVGAYPNSSSPYGTFDQAGNVWEWQENQAAGATSRVLRGAGGEPMARLTPRHRIGTCKAIQRSSSRITVSVSRVSPSQVRYSIWLSHCWELGP